MAEFSFTPDVETPSVDVSDFSFTPDKDQSVADINPKDYNGMATIANAGEDSKPYSKIQLFLDRLKTFEVNKSNNKEIKPFSLEGSSIKFMDKTYAEQKMQDNLAYQAWQEAKGGEGFEDVKWKEVGKSLIKGGLEVGKGVTATPLKIYGDWAMDNRDTSLMSAEEKRKVSQNNFTAKAYSKVGEYLEKLWDMGINAEWLKPDEEVFRGSFVENPSLTRTLSLGAAAIPSVAWFGGIYKATNSKALASMLLASADADDLYFEARESGKSQDEALALYGAGTVGTAALEKYGFEQIFNQRVTAPLAKRVFTAMTSEGLTEGAQSVWQNMIKKYGYDDTQSIWEGVIESVIGGALSGGAISAADAGYLKLTNARNKLKEQGMTDDALDKLQESIATEMGYHASDISPLFQDNITKSLSKLEEFIKENEGTAEAQKAMQTKTELEEVYNTVNKSLTDAGVNADVANADAKVWQGIALFGSQETGLSPMEYLNRNAPRVEKARFDEFKKRFMDKTDGSSALDILRQDIARLKKGVSRKSAKGLRLSQFIKQQGGINDDRGDIKSMGATVGLLNKNGISLDEATRLAWEAGYIQGTERPEINQLLDLLSDDLGNKPVYNFDDQMKSDDRQYYLELERAIDEAGADINKDSVEEIAKKLDAYSAKLDSFNRSTPAGYDEALDDFIPFQMAGPKALTAALDELERAKQLEKDKVNNEKIRQETGWFKGVDGKWRFEISDKDADFNKGYNVEEWRKNGTVFTGLSFKLETILKHDKLFDAYPFLRKVQVVYTKRLPDGVLGNYDDRHIDLASDMDAKKTLSVLMHEIQHAIQEYEGFARGGNYNTVSEQVNYYKDLIRRYNTSSEVVELENNIDKNEMLNDVINVLEVSEKPEKIIKTGWYQERVFGTPKGKYRKEFIENKARVFFDDIRYKYESQGNVSLDEYLDMIQNGNLIEIKKEQKSVSAKIKRLYKKAFPKEYTQAQEWIDKYDDESISKVELYRRLYGEVEARNTQARMNMTEEERKATPPEETQDVKNADAIVVFDDGTAMAYEPGIRKIEIKGNEIGEYNGNDKEYIKKAKNWYKENLYNKPAFSPIIGKVDFFNRQFSETKDKNIKNIENLKYLPAVRSIIEQSSNVKEEKPFHTRKDDIVKFYRITEPVYLGENVNNVSVLVAEDKRGNKYYNLDVNNEKSPQSISEERENEGIKTDQSVNINVSSSAQNVKGNVQFQSAISEEQLEADLAEFDKILDSFAEENKEYYNKKGKFEDAKNIQKKYQNYFMYNIADASNPRGIHDPFYFEYDGKKDITNIWTPKKLEKGSNIILYRGAEQIFVPVNEFDESKFKKLGFKRQKVFDEGLRDIYTENKEEKSDYLRDFERIDGKYVRKPETYYQSAFAGSRVDYDQPSLEAIGSGEGNQAHGWGLYYALDRDVAEGYRERSYSQHKWADVQSLDQEFGELKVNGKPFLDVYNVDISRDLMETLLYKPYGVIEEELENRIKGWQNRLEDKNYPFKDYATEKIEAYSKLKNDLYENGVSLIKQDTGQVHEVDIPENPYLLDEQAGYEAQPELVKKVFDRISEEFGIKTKGTLQVGNEQKEINGKYVYNHLADKLGSPRQASMWLNEQGIKGITYDGKQDGRCFVIFNPKDVKVIQKFYQDNDQSGRMPKGAFMENLDSNGVIYLFEKADASTFMHETAHFFRKELRSFNTARSKEMLKQLDAWENAEFDKRYNVRQDLNGFVVTDKVGNIVYGAERPFENIERAREYAKNELFARGFEQFLREGKAPNNYLKQAFRSFWNWLRHLYKAAQDLNVELSDDVRKIYGDILGGQDLDFYLSAPVDEVLEQRVKTNEEVEKYMDDVIKQAQAEQMPKVSAWWQEKTESLKGKQEWWNKAMVPISTRAKRVNQSLRNRLRAYDFRVNNKYNEYMAQVKPFLDKWATFNEQDSIAFDLALKNGYMKKQLEIVKKYNAYDEFVQVKNLLNNLFDQAIDLGIELGYTADYFPRQIEDVEGFMKYLHGSPFESQMRRALYDVDPDNMFTMEEKAEFINKYLRGFVRNDLNKPLIGNTKDRRIEVVDAELNKFYKPSIQALISYIDGMNNSLESRRFWGFKYEDINQSIGALTADLIDRGMIRPDQDQEVKELLTARFRAKGVTNRWLKRQKNFSYIYTMGGLNSAITQIDDISVALYKAGFWNTVNSIFSKKKAGLSREELGLEKIGQEFAEASTSSKAVSAVFKATGLDKIDAFGKNVLINATFDKFQKLANTNEDELRRLIEPTLEQETNDTIEDIKKGIISENVKLLMFNELADMQPISLSEMPEWYLTSGNGRVFYMLKTFALKRIDIFRNECFDKIKNGQTKEGLQNLFRLAMLMVICGMAKDMIIDMLYGRDIDLTDMFVNNLLGLTGIVTKYSLYRTRDEGFTGFLATTAIPPLLAPTSDIISDLYKSLFTKQGKDISDYEIWKGVPIVGRIYYWWFGGGRTKIEKKNKPKLK